MFRAKRVGKGERRVSNPIGTFKFLRELAAPAVLWYFNKSYTPSCIRRCSTLCLGCLLTLRFSLFP